MTIVKINAITVPADAGRELEGRFAAAGGRRGPAAGLRGVRAAPADRWVQPLLRRDPVGDEASFQAWMNSRAFGEQHGKQPAANGQPQRPVSSQAELLAFEVVDLTSPASG
jgi:heme-degrading monooxygenase HmoA